MQEANTYSRPSKAFESVFTLPYSCFGNNTRGSRASDLPCSVHHSRLVYQARHVTTYAKAINSKKQLKRSDACTVLVIGAEPRPFGQRLQVVFEAGLPQHINRNRPSTQEHNPNRKIKWTSNEPMLRPKKLGQKQSPHESTQTTVNPRPLAHQSTNQITTRQSVFRTFSDVVCPHLVLRWRLLRRCSGEEREERSPYSSATEPLYGPGEHSVAHHLLHLMGTCRMGSGRYVGGAGRLARSQRMHVWRKPDDQFRRPLHIFVRCKSKRRPNILSRADPTPNAKANPAPILYP